MKNGPIGAESQFVALSAPGEPFLAECQRPECVDWWQLTRATLIDIGDFRRVAVYRHQLNTPDGVLLPLNPANPDKQTCLWLVQTSR